MDNTVCRSLDKMKGALVSSAVERGDIAYSRFVGYMSIIDKDSYNKYRKPF